MSYRGYHRYNDPPRRVGRDTAHNNSAGSSNRRNAGRSEYYSRRDDVRLSEPYNTYRRRRNNFNYKRRYDDEEYSEDESSYYSSSSVGYDSRRRTSKEDKHHYSRRHDKYTTSSADKEQERKKEKGSRTRERRDYVGRRTRDAASSDEDRKGYDKSKERREERYSSSKYTRESTRRKVSRDSSTERHGQRSREEERATKRRRHEGERERSINSNESDDIRETKREKTSMQTSSMGGFVVDKAQQASVFDFLDQRHTTNNSNSVLGPRPAVLENYQKSTELHNTSRGAVLSDEQKDTTNVTSTTTTSVKDGANAQKPVIDQEEEMKIPQNITRVVLYGVDLCVTSAHINSMMEQLLGCVPWRVRRPARELLALQSEPMSIGAAAAVLPNESSSNEAAGVQVDEEKKVEDCIATKEHNQSTHSTTMNMNSLVNVQMMLPGLMDVNRAGGMVVLELTQYDTALRAVQLLNGAVVNGRRIVATLTNMWHSMRMAVALEPLPSAPGVLQDPMHPLNVAHFTWAVIYRALCTFSPDTLVLRRRRHHSQHIEKVKQQEEENTAVQHSLLTPPRSETHSRQHSHHHTHHRRRSSSRASSVRSYSRDASRVTNEEYESERNRSRASSERSRTHHHRHRHHSRSRTNSQDKKKEEEERTHRLTTTTTKEQDNSTGSIARRAHSADDAQRRHRSRPRRSTSPPKDSNNRDTSKKIEESEVNSEASHSQRSEQHAGERHSRRHHHRRTTTGSSHHHRSRSADQANTARSSSSAQVLPQTDNKEEGSERVRSRTTSSSRGLTHSRRGRNGSESELNSSRASSHGEASLVEQEPLTTVNKINIKTEVKGGDEEEVNMKESVQHEDVLQRLRPGEVNLPNATAAVVTGSVAVLGKPPLSGRHTPRHRTPSATRKTNKTTTTSNSNKSGEEEGDKGELNVDKDERKEGEGVEKEKENEQLNTSTSRSAHKGRHQHRHHSRTASNTSASSLSHVRRSSLDSTHSKGKEQDEEEEEKNSEHGSRASRHRSHRTTKVSNTSLTSHTRTTRSVHRDGSVSKSHHGHKSTSFYSSISSALYHTLGRRDVTRQVYLFSHVLRALPVLGLHWGCHLERQNATLPLLLTMNNSNNSNKSGACAILAAMVPRAVTSVHTVQSRSLQSTTNSYPSQQYNALYEDDRSYIYSSPAIALTTLMTRTTLQLLCHSARQVFFFDDTIAAVHLRSRRFGKRLTGWLLRLGAHTLLDMVFLSVMTPLLCVAADTNIDSSGSVSLSENVFVQKMCVTVPGILNACLNSCAAATLECLIVPWLSQLVNRALVTVCETTEYFILRRYAAYNNTSSSSDEDEDEEDSVERDKEKAQRRAAREAAAHNAIVRAILYRVAAGVGCACVVEHPLRVLVELLRGRATLHLTGLLAEYDAVPRDQCGLSWHSFRSYMHDLRNTSNTNMNINVNIDISNIRGVESDAVNISSTGSSEVPWWVALLRRMGANVGHEVTTIAQSIRHASQQADSLTALEARANAALALGARPSMSESVEYLLRSIASYSPLYGGVQFSVLDKLLSFYMAVWVRLRRQS